MLREAPSTLSRSRSPRVRSKGCSLRANQTPDPHRRVMDASGQAIRCPSRNLSHSLSHPRNRDLAPHQTRTTFPNGGPPWIPWSYRQAPRCRCQSRSPGGRSPTSHRSTRYGQTSSQSAALSRSRGRGHSRNPIQDRSINHSRARGPGQDRSRSHVLGHSLTRKSSLGHKCGLAPCRRRRLPSSLG